MSGNNEHPSHDPAMRHALLSASSANRWLHCPPSARLTEDMSDTPQAYAQQGTDAHALCEHLVKKALGMETKDPTENLMYYDSEMQHCAEDYTAFVLEQVEEAKQCSVHPVVLVEQRVDFSGYVPEGFGTADCLILADHLLSIIDFKYGTGVPVSAENNPQMKLYALGAMQEYSSLYEFSVIRMSIFQPRLANVSTWEMHVDELLQWAEKELKPAANAAFRGEGDYADGPWCRFCKAKSICRKRAEANLSMAKYDFALPPTLDDAEMAVILEKADALSRWAEDVREYALQSALNGKQYPGWKLVEGRANRRYCDEAKAAENVKAAGFNPYEEKLLSVTAMEKLLGRKKFSELLSACVERPQGKPTLVPETDKRPAMEINKTTTGNDFKEEM